jgi:L-ascorbate metabolism protein UlaG (beta-lactamase superfamily)
MKLWKLAKMMFIIIAVLLIGGAIAFVISTDNLAQFGASAEGPRLERIKQSPNFNGKVFINPVETIIKWGAADFYTMLKRWILIKRDREPKEQLPIVQLDRASFNTDITDSLRAFWIGHSSVLVEIDGKRILTDPVWSERCSPSTLFGPKRFSPAPIPLEQLPPLDAVLISHDHYDHLDKNAVCTLAKTGVKFFVPLGVGAHLEKWGIDKNQIIVFDWWDSHNLDDNFRLNATPARHFSGRSMFGGFNKTLWVSWVIAGPKHRVFFSGDTGEFEGLAEIGEKYGPFDLDLIKIGAYSDLWPNIHLAPEQTVRIHSMLKADLLLPIHWGTFNLAFHDWYEPPNRLLVAAEKENIRCVIPQPGQIVSFSDPPPVERWWDKYR